MTPPPKTTWFQDEMLRQVGEVAKQVNNLEEISRDNGKAIELLRSELFGDGYHGRIPLLEKDLTELKVKVELLMQDETLNKGKRQTFRDLRSILTGGGAATLITAIYHFFIRGH